MTASVEEALGTLGLADARLAATCGALASLCPGRERATSLEHLGERAVGAGAEGEVLAVFARALAGIAEAQARHFPGNIFWDFDYVAARLVALGTEPGVSPAEGARRIGHMASLLETLDAAYGCESPIRFRYVHDFVYGFDWARWVAASPAERVGVGPFDEPFLGYLLHRAREIVALIQRGDERYGPLEPGEHRNPFRFARAPDAEALLHRDLAGRGLVPVEAWRHDATPRWQHPYAEEREARALALRLMEPS